MPKSRLFLLTLLLQSPTTMLLLAQPFYARQRFGWNVESITLSQVLTGTCVALGALTGGQIAHRVSPRLAMFMGLIGCLLCTILGWAVGSRGIVPAYVLTLACFAFSQSLVWPALEAEMMVGETTVQVQHFVGFFNLTWSIGAAVAFLSATPLMAHFGLNIFFILPLGFYILNLLFLYFFVPNYSANLSPQPLESVSHTPKEGNRNASMLTPEQRKAFRWLGWLSNPLAFVAINVLIAYNPTVQQRLGISFGAASAWTSLWFYTRALSFEVLRRWEWWHYRWGFL